MRKREIQQTLEHVGPSYAHCVPAVNCCDMPLIPRPRLSREPAFGETRRGTILRGANDPESGKRGLPARLRPRAVNALILHEFVAWSGADRASTARRSRRAALSVPSLLRRLRSRRRAVVATSRRRPLGWPHRQRLASRPRRPRRRPPSTRCSPRSGRPKRSRCRAARRSSARPSCTSQPPNLPSGQASGPRTQDMCKRASNVSPRSDDCPTRKPAWNSSAQPNRPASLQLKQRR